MTRCTICALPQEKLEAIDAGLRAGIPLGRIAESSGFSKSTLSRHNQHVVGRTTALADATSVPAVQVAPPRVTPVRTVATQQSAPVAPPQPPVGPSREELLLRIETLWAESMDGLAAAKQPITVTRPDGGTLEIPGDLRSRVGFLREARGVVELAGAVTGNLVRGDTGGAHVAIQIVCPAGAALPSVRADDGAVTIDIGSGGR